LDKRIPSPFSDSFDFHLHQKGELKDDRSGWENPILADTHGVFWGDYNEHGYGCQGKEMPKCQQI